MLPPDDDRPANVTASNEAHWRPMLEGSDPRFGRFRRFFKHIPGRPRCKTCLSPFGPPGGPFMRLIGKTPWDKNPHFCRWCYEGLQRRFGGAEIELTMLFADVRGSTGLAERMSATEFSALMNRFYRVAVDMLIERDAVIDKLVGDEIVALFVPGLAGAQHASRAVDGAVAILEGTGHATGSPWLPIGAAVHTGRAYVGAVGAEGTFTDFTALGDAVNTTARLASAAGTGEILVSGSTALAARLATATLERRQLDLRGRREPVEVFVVRVVSGR